MFTQFICLRLAIVSLLLKLIRFEIFWNIFVHSKVYLCGLWQRSPWHGPGRPQCVWGMSNLFIECLAWAICMGCFRIYLFFFSFAVALPMLADRNIGECDINYRYANRRRNVLTLAAVAKYLSTYQWLNFYNKRVGPK